MSLELLHDVTFGLLFFSLFVAVAVVIERSLFMWFAEHFAQQREAASMSAFTQVHSALTARLWLLDTVVTAAPLLGLLGTILGIISTFVTLATSGVSDSERVAAGIGTALYATALGIGIAVAALVALNWLNNRTEVLCDRFKHVLAVTTIRFFQK